MLDLQWRPVSFVRRRSASTRVNGSATLVGVASLVRESNDKVATKCRCSICGFLQYSVVLHRGLRHSSDKGCIVFMHEHWLIFIQGVW